jgi:F-type H+-transporting ATPase subunit epsilon
MLAEKITLEIVTPERQVVTEGVDHVLLPGTAGYLGVLPGHAPLLTSLAVGQIAYSVGKETRYLAVSGGFAEVLPDSVHVLATTCEPAEEIDLDRARLAKERAEEELREQLSDAEFKQAEVALKRAINRISTHDRAAV